MISDLLISHGVSQELLRSSVTVRSLERVPGHTRLYRRGAVYCHRAAVPLDIIDTCGQREETCSLRTRDHADALRRVKIEAVRAGRKFDERRLKLARECEEQLRELTPVR
ncbi:DUF6538 domain-containing protein [Roseicyclus sediminis]|uniref:DUF6538 domain-containing protein n=1 Tax=Roseicyclus sediminis TaxID=2980997 RepID=UPI0038734881